MNNYVRLAKEHMDVFLKLKIKLIIYLQSNTSNIKAIHKVFQLQL